MVPGDPSVTLCSATVPSSCNSTAVCALVSVAARTVTQTPYMTLALLVRVTSTVCVPCGTLAPSS